VKLLRFALPFCAALLLHLPLLLPGFDNRDARVVLQPGVTAVLLQLSPSRAARRTSRLESVTRLPDVPEPAEKPELPKVVDESRLTPEPDISEPAGLVRPARTADDDDATLPEIAQLRYRKTLQKAAETESVDAREVEGDSGPQGVNSPARLAGLTKPRYPWLSRKRGEQGTVTLSVEVHADGTCGKVKLVRSSGHQRLDAAALKSLRRAKFIPAMRAGQAVTQTRNFEFVFKLRDAGEK
jgi:periplasmic protein TonB